jgi:hypothetical protein
VRPRHAMLLVPLLAAACAPVVTPEPFLSVGLTVAQAGTAAFRQGELSAALRHPLADLHGATLAALERLQIPLETSDLNEKRSVITAREAGGALIEVNITPVSPVVSGLSIKVGLFGDQPLSRLLLDEIMTGLPSKPAG